MPAPIPAPIPALSPDQSAALLLEFARGVLPLPDLAAAAGLSVQQLLAWAESPEIAATLDALEQLAHRHARLAAAIACAPAINLLDQLVNSIADEEQSPPTGDPKPITHIRLSRELGRKSASTIIALGKPPRPKTSRSPKATRTQEVVGNSPKSTTVSPTNPDLQDSFSTKDLGEPVCDIADFVSTCGLITTDSSAPVEPSIPCQSRSKCEAA